MMDKRIKHLLALITSAVESGTLPKWQVELPSPWESWTLLSLVLLTERQIWACQVVEERLAGKRGVGIVPGMPEWEYRFHGRGCCLTHRVTGEAIETETGAGFDFYFWLNHLRSAHNHDLATRKMLALHPSLESLKVTLFLLYSAGTIRAGGYTPFHLFAVKKVLLRRAPLIRRFCELLEENDLGDALDAVGETRKERLGSVLRLLNIKPKNHKPKKVQPPGTDSELPEAPRVGIEDLKRGALCALSEMGAAEFPSRLKKALRERPFSGFTSTAMILVVEADDPKWCDEVYRLLGALSPDGPIPQPALWEKCVHFLLRHGHRTEEMLKELPKAGRNSRGQAALLGLEFGSNPTPLFRRALLEQDSTPMDRTKAASALALLDSPWSRGVLISVLDESSDSATTSECRAALRECRDPAMHRAADDWERLHPSSDEETLLDPEEMVRYDMEKLHDRVLALRSRAPKEK
jgi:hypothetical protein